MQLKCVAQDACIDRHVPERLTVQWHITQRCNLRCRHCYQSAYTHGGLDFPVLQGIAQQVFALHDQWLEQGKSVPLTFTLTGGEPCAHPSFKMLLAFLANHPSRPLLGVLSNGSLIDKRMAQFFAAQQVAFVQLSVEGHQGAHDAIRGYGHFAQVIKASQFLKQAGVKVSWSFTAHQDNFMEFSDVVRMACRCGVNQVWSDRLIPCGAGETLKALDATQTGAYLLLMKKAKDEAKRKAGVTKVTMRRALQFQAQGGTPYHCTAGDTLVTVMHNGELLPCRRLPINVGNILHTPLAVLYESPLMKRLRAFEGPDACTPCLYKSLCKGGLRCLAYAVNGDMFTPDPGCEALQAST